MSEEIQKLEVEVEVEEAADGDKSEAFKEMFEASEEVEEETPEEKKPEAETKEGEDEPDPEPEKNEELDEIKANLAKLNDRFTETQKWGQDLSSENGVLKKEIKKLQRVQAGEPEEDEQEVAEEAKEAATRERFLASEELVIPVFPDYLEIVGSPGAEAPAPFQLAIKADPSLVDDVLYAKNPAKKAYDIGKKYVFAQEYGESPEEIKEKLRLEVREELLAEAKATQKEKRKKKPVKDGEEEPSLRDLESQGSTEKSAVSSPTSLLEIFGR